MVFLKYIYVFDLFKSPLSLLFQKNRFISTKLGIFCSLAISISLLIIAINSDLFKKVLPQVISSNLPNLRRPSVLLKQKILAIGVEDEFNYKGFIDTSVFTIHVTNFFDLPDQKGGFNEKRVEKKLHICLEKDFENPQIFKELRFANHYCIEKEDNDFQLEGFFDEPKLNYAEIGLKICDGTNENITCKNSSEMNERLNGMTFNIYFQDTVIDVQNYENPIKETIVNKYITIDLNFYKNSELYFQKVNFTSDDGWIFDNKNEFTEYIFESTISDFASISYRNIGSTRAAFQLYSSKTLHKIERQYIKASDLLAKLGGVMQGLYLICFLFIFLEHSLFLKCEILNSLYIFQENPDSKSQNPKRRFSSLKNLFEILIGKRSFAKIKRKNALRDTNTILENINSKTNMAASERKLENSTTKTAESWLKTFLQIKRKLFELYDYKKKASNSQKLNFSIFKYLILKIKDIVPCFKHSFEEEMFIKSEKIYEKELDFIEILKKLQDIDKLKKFLFNKKQLVLFNCLSQPLLYLDKNISQKKRLAINLNSETINSKNELSRIINYYENRQKTEKLTKIDERLFYLLNDEVYTFLKKK